MNTQVMTRLGIAARMLEMAERLERRVLDNSTDDEPLTSDQALDVIDALALRNMADAMQGRL